MAFKSPIEKTKAEVIYLEGTVKWANIIEPNQFGQFSINLYPEQSELDKYVERLEAIRGSAAEEVEAAGKKINGLADVVKEDDEGEQFIQAKLPLEGYEGKNNKIDVYDIKGELIQDFDKLVGNGSKIKAKLYVKPYYMNSNKMVGISTKFYAIQLVDLIEYGAKDSFSNLSNDDIEPNF